MIRHRVEKTANYHAIFVNGKTLRMPINSKLAVEPVEYPEFYDVAINSWCAGGCNGRLVNGFPTTACYTSATTKGKHFDNIVEKINSYFGSMSLNQRPFQVALGGAGEPTAHPKFKEVLQAFRELQIVPNITTNGMHFSDATVDAIKQYCGGVAVTCHPHLEKYWRNALDKCIQNKIVTNVHIVISHEASINLIGQLYDEYKEGIDYFVLLPWMNTGFAKDNPQQIAYNYLEEYLDKRQMTNIAFGANFYNFLQKVKKWDLSLYPPEQFSAYLVMDDNMHLYNNSFDMQIRKDNHKMHH